MSLALLLNSLFRTRQRSLEETAHLALSPLSVYIAPQHGPDLYQALSRSVTDNAYFN
jgi:hypothetical protein